MVLGVAGFEPLAPAPQYEAAVHISRGSGVAGIGNVPVVP